MRGKLHKKASQKPRASSQSAKQLAPPAKDQSHGASTRHPHDQIVRGDAEMALHLAAEDAGIDVARYIGSGRLPQHLYQQIVEKQKSRWTELARPQIGRENALGTPGHSPSPPLRSAPPVATTRAAGAAPSLSSNSSGSSDRTCNDRSGQVGLDQAHADMITAMRGELADGGSAFRANLAELHARATTLANSFNGKQAEVSSLHPLYLSVSTELDEQQKKVITDSLEKLQELGPSPMAHDTKVSYIRCVNNIVDAYGLAWRTEIASEIHAAWQRLKSWAKGAPLPQEAEELLNIGNKIIYSIHNNLSWEENEFAQFVQLSRRDAQLSKKARHTLVACHRQITSLLQTFAVRPFSPTELNEFVAASNTAAYIVLDVRLPEGDNASGSRRSSSSISDTDTDIDTESGSESESESESESSSSSSSRSRR